MTKYKIKCNEPFQILSICNKPPYEIEIEADSISDGHHTMDELYEHRHRLFLALIKMYDNYLTPLGNHIKCWKSQVHDDNTYYSGWFILGMTVTKPKFDISQPDETFDISYHLPMKYWHNANVVRLNQAPPYDGYTSNDVLERLMRL